VQLNDSLNNLSGYFGQTVAEIFIEIKYLHQELAQLLTGFHILKNGFQNFIIIEIFTNIEVENINNHLIYRISQELLIFQLRILFINYLLVIRLIDLVEFHELTHLMHQMRSTLNEQNQLRITPLKIIIFTIIM
jgi:hypothetical protein